MSSWLVVELGPRYLWVWGLLGAELLRCCDWCRPRLTTLKANPGELRIAGPCLSAGWDMSLDSTVLFLSSFLTARLAGQFPTVAGCGPPQVPHLAGMCLQAVPGLAGQSTTRQICSVPSWGPAHIKQHGGWSPQALKLRWPSWQHLLQTVSTPVSQYCSVLYRDCHAAQIVVNELVFKLLCSYRRENQA